ncbi:tRNA pseudouridine(13) synthase TruD [Candidatus Micrarchaeota archaeon CG1_02_51_15]|nr:MAG: tRNA pseudouridine(13) synthase TruD [Candidatus Micrarchaeota archaeon CG1_02_51_15]
MILFEFKPDEFIVEEILCDGTVLEAGKQLSRPNQGGKFAHFVLEKRGWNTAQALEAIARAMGISRTRMDCAGTKDRNAVTVQLCSAFAVPPERVSSVKLKDLSINGVWSAGDKVRMGFLAGNRFTITLNEGNYGEKPEANRVEERARKSNLLFPNYFGDQRFGSLRANTAEVGRLILQGKTEEAAMNFLAFTDEREHGAGREARERLAEEKDFTAALKYFPPFLKYERTVLYQLAQHPRDFVGGLRRLPRHTLLMFVHAFQSRLFNDLLTTRLKNEPLEARTGDLWCECDATGFPDLKEKGVKPIASQVEAANVQKQLEEGKAFLAANIVGSESDLTQDETRLLEENGLSKESFKVKSIPEVTSKGGFRTLSAPLKGFKVLEEKPLKLRFALPSGAYATVALKHLLGRL